MEEPPRTSKLPLVIAAVLILAGVGLRVAQYSARLSFWADEVPLLQSMQKLDIGGFFYNRLLDSQVAPPAFMAIQKLVGESFGFGELVQRAPSFAMSCLAMVLALVLGRQALGNAGMLLMVAVVALGEPLIDQASTLKPYSGDVSITALLLLLAIPACERRDVGRFARVALLAAVAIWMSHASIIVYGAVAVVMLVRIAREGKKLLGFAVVNLLPAASLAAMWWFLLRLQQGDDYLRGFWVKDFPNWQAPLSVLWWLPRRLVQTTTYATQQDALAILAVPLIIAGVIGLWRSERGRVIAMLGLAVIGVSIAMALAGKYPLSARRVNLFLVIPWMLLAGAGLDLLAARTRPAAWGALLVFVGSMLWRDVPYLVQPETNGDARLVVEHVQRTRPGATAIYVPQGVKEFQWYWPGRQLVDGPPPPDATGRFWIVASSTTSRLKRDVAPVVETWRGRGQVVDEFRSAGGLAVCVEVR